jgi:hypothetical protein
VADTSFGRQTDTVTGAARKIDSNHSIVWTTRPVARGIRWAEHRHDGRADGDCQVHRAGVAGNQEIQSLENAGKCEEVDMTSDVDDV